MTSEFIHIHLVNAALDLEELIPLVEMGHCNFENATLISTLFRRMAIASLLLEGLPISFFENLFRSSRCFAFYLRNGAKPDEQVLSRMTSFLDAVACCDHEGALQIANSSVKAFKPDIEYEDDFLFYMFLMQKFYLGGAVGELEKTLARYQKLLDGGEDARWNICYSYLKNDSILFEDTMAAFLQDHMDQYDRLRALDGLPDEELCTEGVVSVEALALLRLGEKLGFDLDDNLTFVPITIRPTIKPMFEPEGWRKPIKILGQQIDGEILV